MRDTLTRLEKAALVTLAAGNAFNILLFAMGATLADARVGWWLLIRAVFAVVQFVAFDLTIVTTVQAMRDGRRSKWGGATVFVAALAAVAIGVDVSTWRMPFLHAAYAVVLPLFMMHLAQPKAHHDTPAPQPDTPQVEQSVTVNVLSVAGDTPALSRTARVKQLAGQLGKSESTVRRMVARGDIVLEDV